MARSLNLMQSIGNLGKDPEGRYTPTGRFVATGSIAMNRTWKDANGEERSQTEWLNWEAWGKAGEIINQYAKKGDKIYLQGRIQTDRAEGRDGGPDKFFTKLVVQEFMFLSGSRTGENHTVEAPEGEPAVLPVEDDLPF